MWWVLLVVSIFLIVLLTPVTVFPEPFSTYDGIQSTPPPDLIRNGQKEEEDIHRRDVVSRVKPYIP